MLVWPAIAQLLTGFGVSELAGPVVSADVLLGGLRLQAASGHDQLAILCVCLLAH